jgi:hypothetical protein
MIQRAMQALFRLAGLSAHGSPAPVFEATGFFTATFYPNPEVRAQSGTKSGPSTRHVTPEVTTEVTREVTGQVTGQVAGQVAGEVLRLLEVLATRGEMPRSQAQSALRLRSRTNFRDRYTEPALVAGLLEMTVPDRPRSSKQRYRITPLGIEVLRRHRKEP